MGGPSPGRPVPSRGDKHTRRDAPCGRGQETAVCRPRRAASGGRPGRRRDLRLQPPGLRLWAAGHLTRARGCGGLAWALPSGPCALGSREAAVRAPVPQSRAATAKALGPRLVRRSPGGRACRACGSGAGTRRGGGEPAPWFPFLYAEPRDWGNPATGPQRPTPSAAVRGDGGQHGTEVLVTSRE